MTSSRAEESPGTSAATEPSLTPAARTPRLTRRAAFVLAGGTLGVLGIGWLADALAVAPLTPATTGPLSAQVGLLHVTLALNPSTPRAGATVQATITIRGADGTAQTGLAVDVAATMIEMAMPIPAIRAQEQADPAGYGCTLVFAMAGAWRVDVRFAAQAEAPHTATFDVGVR